MNEANKFLQHQVEALKKELDKKNVELEEKNHLLKFYERDLSLKPEPQERINDQYPACFHPLHGKKLSY